MTTHQSLFILSAKAGPTEPLKPNCSDRPVNDRKERSHRSQTAATAGVGRGPLGFRTRARRAASRETGRGERRHHHVTHWVQAPRLKSDGPEPAASYISYQTGTGLHVGPNRGGATNGQSIVLNVYRISNFKNCNFNFSCAIFTIYFYNGFGLFRD